MRFRFFSLLLALSAVLSLHGAVLPEEKSPDVAAVVNGEAVLKSEVDDGIPEAVFKSKMKLRLTRALKIERLIDLVLQKQFVSGSGMEIKEADVDAAIAEHRNRGAVSSCACGCSGFKSLEDFLAEKMMSMKEYRDSIRVGIGLRKHVDILWGREYGDPAKLKGEIETKRSELEKSYIKTAGIFFRNPAKTGMDANEALAKAEKAWERLEKGESFSALAAELSEDKATASKGGDLGCQMKSQLVPDVLAAVEKLEPGRYSKPIKTWNGCVILMRMTMQGKDLEDVMRMEFDRKTRIEIAGKIRETAKIEKK